MCVRVQYRDMNMHTAHTMPHGQLPLTNRVGHVAEDLEEHKERCAWVQDHLLQAVVEACRIEQWATSVVLPEQTCTNLG